MTPDDLRKLAEGRNWHANANHIIFKGEAIARFLGSQDARLAALAPDLARLCAELGEALETICDIGETRDVEVARSALAKLAELEAR
jgi:hypothetical protein